MKNKTGIRLLLGAFVALLFAGCAKDETDYGQGADSRTVRSRYITAEEFKANRQAFEKLGNTVTALKRQQSSSKMAYDSLRGFYVDTERILLVEQGDYKSYTFAIVRNEGEDLVENMILSFKDGVERATYFAKYELTEQEKKELTDGNTIVGLSGKTSVTTENGVVLFSRGAASGIIVKGNDGNCYRPDEVVSFADGTVQIKSWIRIKCPEDLTQVVTIGDENGDGNGGGSGTGGGLYIPSNGGEGYPGNAPGAGSGGGSGGGGHPTNPTPTDPDPGHNIGEEPVLTAPVVIITDHKRELKKISNNSKVKSKIKELKLKTTDPNWRKEGGAQYIKTNNGYDERDPNYIGSNETRFDPDFEPGTEIILHLHSKEVYIVTGNAPPELANIAPVFSSDDIYGFLGLAEFNNFENNNVTAIVVTYGGTYAMRSGDPVKMEAAKKLLDPVGVDANDDPIDSDDMENLKSSYQRDVINACDDFDSGCFKTSFAKFLKTFKLSNGQDLGILLFEAVYDSEGNITGWIQL